MLLDVPQRRGGPDVLRRPAGSGRRGGRPGCGWCRSCSHPTVAARVIFDLGLVRNLGYYTGAVFEVYDPALGTPIGGGGRYDELLGRFGRPLPAVGFALGVERLHIALAGEERGSGAVVSEPARRCLAMSLGGGLTIAVPRGQLFEDTVALLDAARTGHRGAARATIASSSSSDIGVITMRPSDVPTYVEAGAADLGITGRDVLLEQAQLDGEHGREVYELLDLGYGRPRWCSRRRRAPR